ncbi:MAG: MmcQ/YjbR family DNA-binding protein [Cryomorphaceae bacterium]|nr:MmcQ/YjbR family DNA-binding protein [Flavobacteriales bacterium]
MNIEEYRAYCLRKKGVTESFPFDSSALVFKVMGKMFSIANIDDFTGFSAKCDPERALVLREEYPDGIVPAYHMSKKHWNGVKLEQGVPEALIYQLIDDSYDLVVAGLPKKLQAELAEMK